MRNSPSHLPEALALVIVLALVTVVSRWAITTAPEVAQELATPPPTATPTGTAAPAALPTHTPTPTTVPLPTSDVPVGRPWLLVGVLALMMGGSAVAANRLEAMERRAG